MITQRKLTTLHHKVDYCLDRFPETRNSDIDLFARLCENFYPPFEHAIYNWRDLAGAMHSVPSLDHIARVRRKVIQENRYLKYLPTDKGIALHRGYSQKVWNEYARLHNIPEPLTERNIPIEFDDEGNHRTPPIRNGEYVNE
jgi:hypothetical protein